MPGAGLFDRRVTFLRRALADDGAGNTRGGFAPVLTVWAGWRATGGQEIVEGGRAVDAAAGTLTIRDTPAARQVTAADRVLFSGDEWAILSVAPPERRRGTIALTIARRQA
ncbi:MAG TPA: head-tail adaptor protein [Beijerinckiaceae bacterium]|nr:head-tail adaptor protein [Beijerinckiaceae bacterium]